MNKSDFNNQILNKATNHLYPARMNIMRGMGLGYVLGRQEGYRVWDTEGQEFLDLDLRAGVYNLGHHHPEIVKVLKDNVDASDLGQSFFVNEPAVTLAEKLANSAGLQYVVFTPSGTEANDIAIRTARRVTNRRKVVSCSTGYHGAAGLASAAGNPDSAKNFKTDYPDEFYTASVNDLEKLSSLLSQGDFAAIILEPSNNASGYPLTETSYFKEVRRLCDDYGTVLIIDEVVTGLGRTGKVWGHQHFDFQPDIIVTGKGLSGGMYPIAATILSKKAGAWLQRDISGYMGTYAGGPLACLVGNTAFDLSCNADTLALAKNNANYFRDGLNVIANNNPVIKNINQFGLLYGIEIDQTGAGMAAMIAMYKAGLITMIAPHVDNVLNIKLGHLVDEAFCSEALNRLEAGFASLKK